MSAYYQRDDNRHYVAGCHGTIAEQGDEAHYDGRDDADDDVEKGRLKFGTKVYGRENELGILRDVYQEMLDAYTSRRALNVVLEINPNYLLVTAVCDSGLNIAFV